MVNIKDSVGVISENILYILRILINDSINDLINKLMVIKNYFLPNVLYIINMFLVHTEFNNRS